MSQPTEPAVRNSYLDFYVETYGQFIVEKKLVEGREAVGMFLTRQPAGQFPDDAIEEYSIQMLASPKARARLNLGAGEFDVLLRRSQFVVTPPRTASEYDVHDDHMIFGFGVPTSYFEATLRDTGRQDFAIEGLLKSGHADKIVERLIRESWKEAETGGDLGALYVDTNILAIASRIVALATKAQQRDIASDRERISDPAMRLITDYVDSNVDTAIRMKTLANLARMNEFEFSRAFKARTGLPPYQWVIEQRVNKAQQLLRRSSLPIAEIAYACGFSSQAHMTSLFSKRLGLTPAQVRGA